jgi:hypothetical protein
LADHVGGHVNEKERDDYAVMIDVQKVELPLLQDHDDGIEELVKLKALVGGEGTREIAGVGQAVGCVSPAI